MGYFHTFPIIHFHFAWKTQRTQLPINLASIMTAFYQVEDLIVYSALDCTEYRRKQPKMCHKIELSYPLSSRLLLRLPCVCRGAWPKAKEGAATSVCCLFSISLHWGGKTSDRRTQVCGKFITIKVLPFFFAGVWWVRGRGEARRSWVWKSVRVAAFKWGITESPSSFSMLRCKGIRRN